MSVTKPNYMITLHLVATAILAIGSLKASEPEFKAKDPNLEARKTADKAIELGLNLIDNARRKAEAAKTLSNLKQITGAIFKYAANNKGKLPDDLAELVDQKYLAAGPLFVVTKDPKKAPKNAKDIREGMCSFEYYGKGRKLGDLDASAVLVCTKGGEIDGKVCAFFGDGHGRAVDAKQIGEAVAKHGWKLPK